MFTGIVEATGTMEAIEFEGTNLVAWISCPFTSELKPDQSLAHDGVCLTVESINRDQYRVSAVAETLAKTTLGNWKQGLKVNLERALKAGDRLDGHMVQGHVDSTAFCTSRKDLNGSWIFEFEFNPDFAPLIIEKGSICVNGISLTAFNVTQQNFEATIIPYSFVHTGISQVTAGTTVNIEFDVVGKYIIRWQEVGNGFTNPRS